MSDNDNDASGCLGAGFLLLIGLQFFAVLIGTIIIVFVGSLIIGLFISLFVGLVSAIKNSVVGINRSVTNKFMKVTLFSVIGLVVLAIIAPVGLEAYTLIATAV